MNDCIPHKTGQLVKGKGIYVGTWSPLANENRFIVYGTPIDIWKPKGRRLSEEYNLYASPNDFLLTDRNRGQIRFCFNDALKHVSSLKNWHGHNGSSLKSSRDIARAVEVSDYASLSKWFIPTTGMLNSVLESKEESTLSNVYWTSDVYSGYVHTLESKDRIDGFSNPLIRHRVRPVRIEPRRF